MLILKHPGIIIYLQSNRSNVVVLLFCSLMFFIPALFRVYFHAYPADDLLNGLDDWNRYAQYAIDIKNNGLLLHSVNSNYLIPAGFLYNYFVALIFVLFGENPVYVYLIQSILLGISISLIWFIFRDLIKPSTSFLFLILLIVFAFIDIYKYYTFRLLSENLAIITVTLFFVFFKKAFLRPAVKYYVVSGVMLGISVLVRPNILPFGMVFLLLLLVFHLYKKMSLKNFRFILLSFLITISALPLRNYMVTGELSVMPVNGNLFDYMSRENPFSIMGQPVQHFLYYGKKMIYCLGYLPILEPKFQIRPHWILMWVGWLSYLVHLLIRPRKATAFELTLLIFVVMFYLTLILIAPISNYGFRMLVPVLFFVLGISMMGFEKLLTSVINFRRN